MAAFLKQSTTVTIRLGPFLDKTDGVSEETGITPVVEVSKNHGAFGARNSATAITHDSNGWFAVELDTTDTGTLGPLIVKSDDSATHLPVWREFQVVPGHVYDGLIAGSDNLQVDAVQFTGQAITAAAGVTMPASVGTSTLDAAGVRTAVGLGAANLDTQLGDIPTVAEFEARTLVAASYFDPAADTVANVTTVGSVTGAVGSVTGAVGSVTATVDANLIQIDGLTTADQSAILYLRQLNIYNTSGNAVEIFTDAGHGISISATGAAKHGIYTIALTDGDGLHAEGFSSGAGIMAQGGGLGHGVEFSAGAGGNSNGIYANGFGGGSGMQLEAGATGNAIRLAAGGTSGDVFSFTAVGGGSLALPLVTLVDTTTTNSDMRGTDSAALAAAWTATRADYLDNLNVGGLVASSTEATAIQNNTRAVRVVPCVIERPDSGTTTYRLELLLYDSNGNMEAPDATPTISVANETGVSRDANLDSTTMTLVDVGRYRSTYTVADDHAIEQLVVNFSVIEGGQTRTYGNTALVVDTTAVDFTADDRTKLASIYDKLPSANYLTGTAAADGSIAANTIAGNFTGSVGSIAGVSFPSNFGALGINVSGHVSRVTLVDTTAVNSDMRGTDSAALAAFWTATRAGYIDNLNGHTPQTGDTYALAAGASGFAALKSETALIVADTNELQTDWADGGRLDLILDIIAADVVNLDGAAMRGTDSALLAASYTAPLTAATTRDALGMASADLDTQLAAISTAAITVAAVADGVWDEVISGHATAGTGGAILSDILAASESGA